LTNLNPLPFAHQLAGYSHLPRLSSSFLVAFYLCRQFINAKGGVGGGGGVAANGCIVQWVDRLVIVFASKYLCTRGWLQGRTFDLRHPHIGPRPLAMLKVYRYVNITLKLKE